MIKDLTSFISGICLIILSVVLFHEANQLSPFASVFPYAITSVLLLLSVLLIFRSFKIEIKVEKENVDTVKIFLLIIVFFCMDLFFRKNRVCNNKLNCF